MAPELTLGNQEIAGIRIKHPDDIVLVRERLGAMQPGQAFKITVLRAGRHSDRRLTSQTVRPRAAVKSGS